MFEVHNWVFELTGKLKKRFGSGLCFVGYQGSFRRGEANKNSDIDVVVIFEHVDINILVDYKNVIESMPFAEKACGFICGKKELEKAGPALSPTSQVYKNAYLFPGYPYNFSDQLKQAMRLNISCMQNLKNASINYKEPKHEN